MGKQIIVHKSRTTIIGVSLGMDVSQDTFASEIRVDKNSSSPLIVAWDIAFATDGVDGELILTIDDSASAQIVRDSGYMDLKRITSGEPLPVFEEPLEVIFQSPVTE